MDFFEKLGFWSSTRKYKYLLDNRLVQISWLIYLFATQHKHVLINSTSMHFFIAFSCNPKNIIWNIVWYKIWYEKIDQKLKNVLFYYCLYIIYVFSYQIEYAKYPYQLKNILYINLTLQKKKCSRNFYLFFSSPFWKKNAKPHNH